MQRFGRVLALLAIGLMVMLTVVDVAEARRASSGFGSRGTRTFSAPPITRTAPTTATPIDRTMSQRQATQPATGGQNAAAQPQRRGFFGGLGGTLLGGLMMGGLIGMLFGGGLGGGIGFLGLLLQAGLILGAVMLAMRFFGRNNQQPAFSGSGRAAATGGSNGLGRSNGAGGSGMPSFSITRIGQALGGSAAASKPADEIGIAQRDLDRFDAMLKDVQAAYGAEDYPTLRRLTTPEAMSYLAEELSENATKGLRNEVRDVHLVQGDVAEAWREDGADYATVAMRYESIDAMRDRATGKVVSGDPDKPTEAVELWTFVRKSGADWQVSAIQGVAA